MLHSLLTWALQGSEWSDSCCGRFTLRGETYFDPRAGVDVSGEHRILVPPPSIEPRFVVCLTHSQRKTSSVSELKQTRTCTGLISQHLTTQRRMHGFGLYVEHGFDARRRFSWWKWRLHFPRFTVPAHSYGYYVLNTLACDVTFVLHAGQAGGGDKAGRWLCRLLQYETSAETKRSARAGSDVKRYQKCTGMCYWEVWSDLLHF